MPCSDGGPSMEQQAFERDRIRGLAVGLCIACATLEARGGVPDVLAAWYAAHRAADESRDWEDTARAEFHMADQKARAEGYPYLSAHHPARQRLSDASRITRECVKREHAEAVKISRDRPERK